MTKEQEEALKRLLEILLQTSKDSTIKSHAKGLLLKLMGL